MKRKDILGSVTEAGYGRAKGRDAWDSNMPGYQGDYGGEKNWGRREREDDEHHEIDRRREQQLAQYNASGDFWLKRKDTQEIISKAFVGKAAANAAAIELLQQQPELKGNLLITAHGPSGEGVEEGKLGTAAALAGAIALGGAMGYKHSTKDPNVEPTIKTKYERNAEVGAKLKKKISGDQKNEGVAEGVAETLPMHDAVKVLRQYGADNFKTTSNELHFYKQGRPFSVDLIWGNEGERSVNLSQLNSATRRLKGQGVAEVRNTGDDYDDMIEDYLDWLESHNMFLHKTREEEKAQIISDLENGYLHSSEIEYAMGEGKEDNIAKLKQNYKDAIYWSKHERSPQKREAARLVAEKIKRHLQKQYQHSMSEATPMAGQTGEITDMQPGKSVTVSAPSGQQGINTMTQIDLTKNPAALSKNDKGELVLKLTPNAGGTPSPTTQQPPQKGTAVKFEALDSILRIAGLK